MPPTLFRTGFRPFFFGGAIYAIIAMVIWLMTLLSLWVPPATLAFAEWHAHEMFFGYIVAIVAGFLLTAVQNWTKLVTVRGWWLAALFFLWLLGRVAMVFGQVWPSAARLIDFLFLPTLAVVIGRPLFLARSHRNYGFVVLLLMMAAANAVLHGIIGSTISASRALQAAIDLVLLMVAIVAGRIVPMFTRNALSGALRTALRPRGRRDTISLYALVILCGSRFCLPESRAVLSLLYLATATLHLWRMRGWGTWYCLRNPIISVLHLGYAWLVVSLFAGGLAQLGFVPQSLATHAATTGAMGTFTLAMMSRVTLGHTGRAFHADRLTCAVYLSVNCSAILRLFAAVGGAQTAALWSLSALSWTLSFGLYLMRYAKMLLGPRADGKPG